MKFERIPELVTSATAIVVGFAFAFFCARLTGEGEMKMVVGLSTLIGLGALMLGMRTGIWLLIPFCWELTGRIPIVDYPFSIRDFSVAIVLIAYLIFYALKILRYRQKFEFLDLLVAANLLYLGTVFLRNPVGVRWLGSEMVGGRPYFDIFIGVVAFWLLSRVPVRLPTIRRLPIVLLVGSALLSVGAFIITIAPWTEAYLGQIYSYFAPPDPTKGQMTEDTLGRKPHLVSVGNSGMKWLCSYYNPLTLFSPFYPFRFLGVAISAAAILFSGYRSAAFSIFVYVCLASFFRKRIRDIVIFSLIGGLLVTFAAVGHGRIFELPRAVQRALSFLPGNWDYEAVRDAKDSSNFRYEMWRKVLTEDRWIRNKWLGDGFGFTKHDLAIMESRQGFALGGNQEAFLISGTYHSGPLTTIRFVGVVGLLLYLPLMIYLVIRYMRLIRECFGTPLFPVALFVGMPVVFAPFPYVFVAGMFDVNLTDSLFAAGLLRILCKALELQKAELKPEPVVLEAPVLPLRSPARRRTARPIYPLPS